MTDHTENSDNPGDGQSDAGDRPLPPPPPVPPRFMPPKTAPPGAAPPGSMYPPSPGQPQPGQPQPGQPQPGQPQPAQPAQVVVVENKSMAVAYILWFLLGNLGIHKFYLRQTGLGVLYLSLGVVGWATSWLLIGFFFLAVLWLLMIIDLFLIPGRVRALNWSTQQAMTRGYGPQW